MGTSLQNIKRTLAFFDELVIVLGNLAQKIAILPSGTTNMSLWQILLPELQIQPSLRNI